VTAESAAPPPDFGSGLSDEQDKALFYQSTFSIYVGVVQGGIPLF
jgi:hypothetical protein